MHAKTCTAVLFSGFAIVFEKELKLGAEILFQEIFLRKKGVGPLKIVRAAFEILAEGRGEKLFLLRKKCTGPPLIAVGSLCFLTVLRIDKRANALVNSLILGVASCAVSAVIGTLGAVGLSRIHWKTKGALEYISILPLMIPEIILGMVLMAFFYMLNLPFGMLTLLIGHTVFCIPYILMEVKARLVGMDPSLEEAARDLGATSMRAFFDITLPLIMPAVASGSLLAFAMSMDDVVISIFINGPRLSTLPIKVYTQIKTGVTPEINALCTIMLAFTVGILLVYSLMKKLRRRSQ